jgi:hypothetical protein
VDTIECFNDYFFHHASLVPEARQCQPKYYLVVLGPSLLLAISLVSALFVGLSLRRSKVPPYSARCVVSNNAVSLFCCTGQTPTLCRLWIAHHCALVDVVFQGHPALFNTKLRGSPIYVLLFLLSMFLYPSIQICSLQHSRRH